MFPLFDSTSFASIFILFVCIHKPFVCLRLRKTYIHRECVQNFEAQNIQLHVLDTQSNPAKNLTKHVLLCIPHFPSYTVR